MQQKVVPGIDSFIETTEYDKALRYALVTNNAALTNDGILSREALLKSEFNLVKIFSPEHGINVKGIDGAFQQNQIDEATGLPIISLYGDRLSPTEDDLADVDIVLFDIPDVGCRFYTYLWTMTYVMEACAAFNKPFIVLDRPNPIGGDIAMIEGPMLDEENCSSFIGRWSIPVRHSCTLGELALYFSQKKINGIDLKVIPVQNWARDQMAGTPSFEFYPTSPAINDITTAFVYPGIGLLEGIDINEGRGTDKPFMRFGAPWINAEKLHEQLLDKVFFGIKTKPCTFIPEDSLYKGEECHGLELVITDEKTFYPVSFGIKLMSLLLELYPNQVKQRSYRTYANPSGSGHLDNLIGIKNSFDLLRSGSAIDTDVSALWSNEMSPYYLYA